ncbi:tyrosine-type recombinase/integrase [Undibacterium sp. 5I1]|uniref:tyrosine-type recombinase/integrase n=1 Tax=unclassified Undibacterium TaxID=2630295 RepID=UPI002AB3BDC6|nr:MULTISPECIES: tyrosine-type recombinase/integrase [unclassified Undibacterium]MDY7538756.1 tyrosine-type recombinase/integrase [Undibacterium sp. 5I1]MEB0229695.1 tyrosine-type recombinase/integrase [Undibacterium sp. 10I3]MEB0258440.1 tyrosine-type recombinase/integrase [Undibacterium sp. 5I1]
MSKGISAEKSAKLRLTALELNVLVTKGTKFFPGTNTPIPKGVTVRSANGVQIEFMFEGTRYYETIRGTPTAGNIKKAMEKRERVQQLISLGNFDYDKEFPNSKVIKKLNTSHNLALQNDIVTISTALNEWLDVTVSAVGHNAGIDYKKDATRLKQFPAAALDGIDNSDRPKSGGLLGDLSVLELNDLSIKNLQNWLLIQNGQNTGKTISIKRVNNLMTPLRGAMSRMADAKKIPFDPFTKVRPLKNQKTFSTNKALDKTELDGPLPIVGNRQYNESNIIVEPFSPDEIDALLRQFSGSFLNQMIFWLWTGLRTGELIALRWSDVHWESGQIFVRRSLSRGHLKLPKFDKKRWVKLCAPAREALEAQLKLTGASEGWIFPNPYTNSMWTNESKIRTRFKTAAEKAGVRYRRPYNCRHTFASVMLSSGENTLYVAEQLGHADWTMLVKVYGRWMNEVNHSAGENLAKMNSSAWRSLREMMDKRQSTADSNDFLEDGDLMNDEEYEQDDDTFEL